MTARDVPILNPINDRLSLKKGLLTCDYKLKIPKVPNVSLNALNLAVANPVSNVLFVIPQHYTVNVKQKRNNLWSMKRLIRLFEKIQVDVKVLTDIPSYFSDYSRLNLTKFEFTARDVKTGASFVCFAHKNNSANAATFLTYLCTHLLFEGFNLKEHITFQMDNGAEFFACNNKNKGKTPVETVIEDHFKSNISRMPPASPTFNSDLETFNRLVEDEFYDIEDFISLSDLTQKMYTYLLGFNFLRKNSYKDNKTPCKGPILCTN